jgi:hypothetical protein
MLAMMKLSFMLAGRILRKIKFYEHYLNMKKLFMEKIEILKFLGYVPIINALTK